MFVCDKCLAKKFHNKMSLVRFFGKCESCREYKTCADYKQPEPKVKSRPIKPMSVAQRFNIIIWAPRKKKNEHQNGIARRD